MCGFRQAILTNKTTSNPNLAMLFLQRIVLLLLFIFIFMFLLLLFLLRMLFLLLLLSCILNVIIPLRLLLPLTL